METIDRAEEWRRLKELYLQMSDEELEVVAADAYDLTDVAQQVLQGEIARRGLKIQPRRAPLPIPEPQGDSPPDPEELDLISVRTVWDREDARKTIDALNSSGLPAFLGPENAARVDDVTTSFDRGLDVKVRYVDAERASAALRNAFPNEASEEQGDYIARCPKCRSEEIVLLGIKEPGSAVTDREFTWRCDACGNQWRDDGVEQST